jgi:hypothetical protein
VHTDLARRFLAATAALPPPPIRTIYCDSTTGAYFSAAEVDSHPELARTGLEQRIADGLYYYQTHYGTILNYLRVIELLGNNGVASLEGKLVLDFGYGRIGHLRVLASLGATVAGVDVDPELPALYAEPSDQGPVPGFGCHDGSVTLIDGSFPGDLATRAAVGTSYDLVISKNTLKGGHEPAQRARQSLVVNLGVPDSVFVQTIFESLQPDGIFIMYTISSPKGNSHCPFQESMLRAAKFDIVAYDQDDSPGARAMLRVLHQGQAGQLTVPDDESTATYTVLRKPRGAQ